MVRWGSLSLRCRGTGQHISLGVWGGGGGGGGAGAGAGGRKKKRNLPLFWLKNRK